MNFMSDIIEKTVTAIRNATAVTETEKACLELWPSLASEKVAEVIALQRCAEVAAERGTEHSAVVAAFADAFVSFDEGRQCLRFTRGGSYLYDADWSILREGKGSGEGGEDGDDFTLLPVCSGLRFLGTSHDSKTGDYGLVVAVLGRDKSFWQAGSWREVTLRQDEMFGNGEQWVQRLVAAGLRLQTTPHVLRTLFNNVTPPLRIITVAQVGWTHECKAYVFADEILEARRAMDDAEGSNDAESDGREISYRFSGDPKGFKTGVKGSLEDWQHCVAMPALGNSRLEFALSASFASLLLEPLGFEGGGFHFVGGSSCGKTTALQVAASVFGSGAIETGYVQSWRKTDNALEAVAHRHNSAVLCLDEIGQGSKLGETIYMLANGQGKTRMKASAEVRETLTWKLIFLSTGEMRIADKIEAAGEKAMAGQAVRVVDIGADAGKGLGLFDNTHGMAAGAFADALKKATAECYGTASRAFVQRFLDDDGGDEDLRSETRRALVQRFIDNWSRLYVPADADGQVQRVARRFALVALGGEWAMASGILPWPFGTAWTAAERCFADWLAERGHAGASEAHKGAENVLATIERDGRSRFELIGSTSLGGQDQTVVDRPVYERMGFYERVHRGSEIEWSVYYVFASRWSEVCGGYDPVGAAKLLKERGVLCAPLEGRDLTWKRSFGGLDRQRYYQLIPNAQRDECAKQKVLALIAAFDAPEYEADVGDHAIDEGEIQRAVTEAVRQRWARAAAAVSGGGSGRRG